MPLHHLRLTFEHLIKSGDPCRLSRYSLGSRSTLDEITAKGWQVTLAKSKAHTISRPVGFRNMDNTLPTVEDLTGNWCIYRDVLLVVDE